MKRKTVALRLDEDINGQCQKHSKENHIEPSRKVEEVFTNEIGKVDSRLLETACSAGNVLVAILDRKLAVLKQKYSRKQPEYDLDKKRRYLSNELATSCNQLKILAEINEALR